MSFDTAEPQNILIVDDTVANSELIAYWLKAAGYTVCTAASAREARQVLQDFQPDLALLDVNLPDSNGFDLCREFRAMQHLSGLAVVTTSAVSTRDIDRGAAIESGSDAFISLPAEPAEIVAVVRSVIGMHPSTATQPEIPRAALPSSVLVVQGDDARLGELAAWFTEADLVVTTAASALEARKILDHLVPEVVIIDVDLADDAGLEFSREVRDRVDLDSIAIVHTSAARRHRSNLASCGADAYVTLPTGKTEFVAVVRSLGRMRRAEEAQQRTAQMWDAYFRITNAGMAMVSIDGTVQRVNQALADLQRRPLAELAGRSMLDLIPRENRTLIEAKMAELLGGSESTIQFETYLIRSDGQTVPVGIRATLLRDAYALGSAVIVVKVEDLTERKRVLDELVLARDSKADLLSRTSHEMRTPLNAIDGFAQLLADERLPADARTMIDQIRQSANELTRIVDALLDIAKIEHEGVSAECVPVSLQSVIQQVVDMVRPLSHRSGVTITTDAHQHVALADGGRLTGLLLELVTNAIKYNRFGGSVKVVASTDGTETVIEVRDTGGGIDPAELDAVFEPFHRSKSAQTIEGTGLGLAIARTYAQSMRGTLTVRSELGEGSCFELRLPGAPDEQKPEFEHRDRVLYIEDSPVNARLMDKLLARRLPDYELIVAPDGASGLQLVDELHPVLVLLDYHLPDLDGSEILARIRDAGNAVPVIVVTADARGELADQMTAAGAQAVVTKPFDFDVMINVIESQLAADISAVAVGATA